MENIFTFERPMPKISKLRRNWVALVGGWDFTGKDYWDLLNKAIKITENELERLKKLRDQAEFAGELHF